MKHRALIISVDAIPNIGGVSAFAHFISNALTKYCQEVVFLGPAGTSAPPNETVHYKIVEDIKSKVSLRSGAGFFEEKDRIKNLLNRVIDGYNLNRIILIHPFYYGPAAVELASEIGVSVDVIVHGTELTSQFPSAVTEKTNQDLIRVDSLPFHLYRTLNGATRVVANSRWTARIASNIAPNTNVCVCGCGIDSELLDRTSNAIIPMPHRPSKRLALGRTGDPELCYLGRLVRHKQIHRAFELLIGNNWHLQIVGEGPLRTELEAEAARLGVGERVHFLGALSEPMKWRTLGTSDYLVLPSAFDTETYGYEGFGLVILEAIAAGVVPVCSGLDGMADPVHLYGLGLGGLEPDSSMIKLRERMNSLLNDPEAYQEKAATDLKTVRERLTWDTIADNLVSGW